MTKSEIIKKMKESDLEKKIRFISFLKNENFIETIDKHGFFSKKNNPFYYKKIDENKFLAFNIFDKKKYHCDFWLIDVKSEDLFLEKVLPEDDLTHLKLSFDIDDNIEIYKKHLL